MKVLLVSNMYPDEKHPSYGIFVKHFVDELDIMGIDHIDSVMHRHEGKFGRIVGYVAFYIKTFLMVLLGHYNYVYVHQASHSSLPVLAANAIRKTKIFTNVHGCDVAPENAHQEKMQKIVRCILKKSQRVIVPSEYYREYVKTKYKISDDNIYIYPSAGVDKNVFYEKSDKQKSELREKYYFNKEMLIFGMAGRISEGKGWDTFVKAVAILKKEKVNAYFVIVGDGIESDALDKLIADCGLTTDIIRIGLLPQPELSNFYNVIDYFVFPTKREGESLGLVAIEAMACGTPVIASDFAAPRFYIEDGVNGYKFTVDDSQKLAEIMKKCCVATDNQEYGRLHDGALKTAQAYFSDNIRAKLRNVIEI